MQKYPFRITPEILNLTAEISELSGQINITSKLNNSPKLRRTNRIKTIYSSLAIEQNTLTPQQVTAVIDGKRVLAPPKDVAEVKNAYEIYDCLDRLNPYSVDDLLYAHAIMVKDLVDAAGQFRSKPVGVVDSKGRVVHFGTLPDYIPQLVSELLEWVRGCDLHILIKSCVFHYEFELIHPFSDGNGRIGRLWQTLLLSKWNSFFSWIPIESVIHDRQAEYYRAINESNSAADSTPFIEFMLKAIKSALLSIDGGDSISPKTETYESTIMDYLDGSGIISNSTVRNLLGVSSSTANRILNSMVQRNLLVKIRQGRTWAYRKL